MKRLKLIITLKKEDGAGLVLALMVLMVLAVLGVTVAAVTIGSHKLGHINRDSNSAYYIAEAGANLAYEEIKSGVIPAYANSNNNESIYFTNIAEMIAAYNPEVYAEGTFERQLGSQPKATVTVSGPKDSDGGKRYTIESIGEIDGKTRSVEKEFLVKFVPTTTGEEGETIPYTPPKAALIVKGKVDMTVDALIEGDVYSKSTANQSFSMTNNTKINGDIYSTYTGNIEDIIHSPNSATYGNLYNFQETEIPWADFDAMPDDMIKMPENWNDYPTEDNVSLWNALTDTRDIGESVQINSISMSGSSRLVINNPEDDINIVVNNISLSNSSSVSFTGTGNVYLYIRNGFHMSNDTTINADGDLSKVRLYYFGGGGFSISNNVIVNANVLIKKAGLTISNYASITGAIISGGKQMSISNEGQSHTPMIIIPNGNISMSNTAIISGIIVAQKVTLSNNTKLIYNTFDSGILFPGSSSSGSGSTPGGSGSGSAPTLADLISAGPALESVPGT